MLRRLMLAIVSFIFLVFIPTSVTYANNSPYAPLDASELVQIVATVKKAPQYSEDLFFAMVQPAEPAKVTEDVPKSKRQALITLFNREKNKVYEVLVDITANKIVSWQEVPHVQPIANSYDYDLMPELLKSDPSWRNALLKRGIKDPDKVFADLWVLDAFDDSSLENHRLVRAIPFYHDDTDFIYGRPIEGLGAIVDLTTKKVSVIDTGIVPLANSISAYDSKSVAPLRQAPNYVQMQQPKGPSFQLKDYQLTWQNWRFTLSFNPRDGLVLHNIAYDDNNRWRSILDRVSLSDIVVPYADPDPQWIWRRALDASEYGLGFMSTPLQQGVDVPENAVLLNLPTVDPEGNIKEFNHAVGIYEEYGGFVWKHFDSNLTDTNASRRAQNLVIVSAITVANYDYIVKYTFKQDASIEVKVILTGILLPKGVDKSYHERFGHLVSENIAAPLHQHFFNFRLNFAVDGRQNWLFEHNTAGIPQGPENPTGNAFLHSKTLLKNTLDARRLVNPLSSRFWVVFNPHVTNGLGQPVGYALLPGNNTVSYAQPDSAVKKNSAFVNYHLWATPYDPKQMNAMGLYPVLAKQQNDLAQWAEQNKSLENVDMVLWYTVGLNHMPRPEEWPVMPAAEVSFKIAPFGFFDRNPAINLPEYHAEDASSDGKSAELKSGKKAEDRHAANAQ